MAAGGLDHPGPSSTVYSSRVFEPDKLTTLRALAGSDGCPAVDASADEDWQASRRRDRRVIRFSWKTPMVLPALATMVVYLVSSVASVVPYTSWLILPAPSGDLHAFGYLVIFAILTGLRTRLQLSRLSRFSFSAAAGVLLYGIIQHSGTGPLPWAGDVTTRVASNMGNAIFVAAYLIMIVAADSVADH